MKVQYMNRRSSSMTIPCKQFESENKLWNPYMLCHVVQCENAILKTSRDKMEGILQVIFLNNFLCIEKYYILITGYYIVFSSV